MSESPMMQQYQRIKSSYPDALLLFRMGDFYETFFDDAHTASRVLGLTLTSRQKTRNGDVIPLARTDRIPGFCAYRFLQNGDVIVGITEAAGKPIRKAKDLTDVIQVCRAGDTIHLEILRGGFLDILIDIALRIDDRSFAVRANQIGSMSETVEIELFEIHWSLPKPILPLTCG